MAQRILLVDDEQDLIDLLKYNLEKEGFEIYSALNGREAVAKAKEIVPALILMDVMMPEMDGMEACREIREIPECANTIIAFLTARNEDYSQLAGFDSGGDDYIPKPIKPRILISKVKAWLKRTEIAGVMPSSEVLSNGGIVIDKDKYLVTKGTEVFQLPKKEFELLALLVSAPGRVFTRDYILNYVWGNDVIVGDRTIDVHIRKLREKLGDELFKTIKGVGYKFEP
jgi:two-component system alkaline phosphatase synthesis response regulator PhoP